VLALLSAFRLAAQNPNAPCIVEGQVLNAVTGEALSKAHVTLSEVTGRGGNVQAATTDSTGRFTLQNVTSGTYQLYAERNGYLHGVYGARGLGRPGTPLVLTPGQELRQITVRLTQQGVIMGRVMDDDGEPMSNVQVQTLRYMYQGGRRRLTPMGGQSTNDLGEYRVFGLEPGRYYLTATYRGSAFIANTAGGPAVEENYVPTYYPGSNDPASAAPLEISAGSQLRGIDMTLLRTRTVRIRGRVSSALGSPLPKSTMVMLSPPDGGFFGPMNSAPVRDAEGGFELRGVAPGSYILLARAQDDGRNYNARLPVEVGNNNVDNIGLVLAPGMEIVGHVGLEGTAKVSLTGLNIFLSSRSGQAGMMMGNARGFIKENGAVTFSNVTADQYQLNINLPENLYIKSVRLGSEDSLETGLNLTRGVAGPLEVLLSANGGQVDGTVLNTQQQPAGGASVVLVPESRLREQTSLFKQATTDQTGHFTLKGIAPGEYKLFAWEDIEPGAYQDPEFLKPMESLGEAVSIREGSRENSQLKLIPSGQAGQVTSATGR
jgi:protocatechuate 3,4-dioxygenase beta subunit